MADPPKSTPLNGPLAYVVLLGGFAVMLWVSKPFLASMEDSSRNAECVTNLEYIAAAIDQMPTGPVPCGPWPTAMPSDAATPWEDAPLCWDHYGFERDLALWAQYEVRPEGDGWLATCRLDLDGDGRAVVYEASDRRTAARKDGTED
jgi:hypothetical protein